MLDCLLPEPPSPSAANFKIFVTDSETSGCFMSEKNSLPKYSPRGVSQFYNIYTYFSELGSGLVTFVIINIFIVLAMRSRLVQMFNVSIFETLGKRLLKLFCHTYFYITGQDKLR